MLLDWFSRYNLDRLEAHTRSSSALSTIEVARKKVSICVIDDELLYQISVLRGHGFDIVQVGDISSVSDIDEYDIIACDLRGVGEKFSGKLQGAAIIQELRRTRPEKYIIAYSGNFDRSTMAKVADDHSDKKIPKSADIDRWVAVLDEAVKYSTNPVEKWTRVRAALNEKRVSSHTIAKLETAYCKSVITGNKKSFLKSTRKIEFSDEIKPIIQGLISSAIWMVLAP
ncbi:hypothetical protein [Agrobacterium radiobacter]|uniref:hypothetical protein n=1 Tax=Agrobacterium radiobacter TaxID=362 RepID=UPI003F867DCA